MQFHPGVFEVLLGLLFFLLLLLLTFRFLFLFSRPLLRESFLAAATTAGGGYGDAAQQDEKKNQSPGACNPRARAILVDHDLFSRRQEIDIPPQRSLLQV
ncbi:MAG: hypothetical protein CL681_21085 [Blastopirellula sp.]|nr:hypothetical protein [Blastopirellula sp.]